MGKKATAAPAKPAKGKNPPADSPSLEKPPVETSSVAAPGAVPAGEKPAEVLGVLPSAGTSVVITRDGNTFAEGDVDPQIVVSEHTQEPGVSAPEVIADQGELQGDVQQQPPAEQATPPEVHPAIELAKTFITPSGVPDAEPGSGFHLPEPPDLRPKRPSKK